MSDTEHHCHFCGEHVEDGKDPKGNRHWLSDCRPDLVKHEPGELCTWSYMLGDKCTCGSSDDEHLEFCALRTPDNKSCYAYMNNDTRKWGDEHKHFYEDGPM
jgi:hypothetical protein